MNYPLLAWTLGRDAKAAGKLLTANPYPDGAMRDAWAEGWRQKS